MSARLNGTVFPFRFCRPLRPLRSNLPCPFVTSPARRALTRLRDARNPRPEVWFTSSNPLSGQENLGGGSGKRPDERTLKLGKTIRVLQARLPSLLQTPLPLEILSPQITLHLFPSTHPHLPAVSGRMAYLAALWTSPVAWGRVPIVGNVKLRVLSERMTHNGRTSSSAAPGSEKLVVRWRTQGKTRGRGFGALYRGFGASGQVKQATDLLNRDGKDDEEFTGLFIFEFDEEGRIVTHTIEHAEEGGSWEKTRFVSVTDWLLGKFGGRGKVEVEHGLAWGCCEGDRRGDVRRRRP
ncbi:MAG: hypothetical protein M1833_003303 [Piccolia ochrophora]|nr:MAG: hypothetical protein M1833_003303 [Piccolia ochrophora]